MHLVGARGDAGVAYLFDGPFDVQFYDWYLRVACREFFERLKDLRLFGLQNMNDGQLEFVYPPLRHVRAGRIGIVWEYVHVSSRWLWFKYATRWSEAEAFGNVADEYDCTGCSFVFLIDSSWCHGGQVDHIYSALTKVLS